MKEKDALLVAGEFLKKLPEAAKRLAKRKGMPEADATEALKNRAQAAVGEKLTEDEKAERIKKAKEWKQKFSNQATHVEGRKELQAQVYSQDVKLSAQGKLKELTASYQTIGKEIPDFLRPVDIRYSPEAAAMVLNISRLPRELQEDPYVLYQELMRMEASIDFHPGGATNEAIIEAKLVRNAVMEKIVEKADNNSDFYNVVNDGVFSENLDFYRTFTLGEIKHPGEKPDEKDKKALLEWRQKMVDWAQRRDLTGDLEGIQRGIDARRFVNKSGELKFLSDMQRKLDNGADFETTQNELKIRKSSYNRGDVEEYREKIFNRHRVVEAEIQAQKQAEQQTKDEARERQRRMHARNRIFTPLKRLEPGSKLPPEIQNIWNNIIQDDTLFSISSEGDILKRISELKSAASGLGLNPEQQNIVQGLQEQLNHRIDQTFRGEIPQPNRLYYPREKLLKLIRDPLGFMQKELSELQQIFLDEGPDSERYRQAEEQFQQLQQIFGTDSLFETLEAGLPEDLTPDERSEFYSPVNRDAMKVVQKTILAENRVVLNHLRFLYMISSSQEMAKDSPRIVSLAESIGMSGVLRSRQRYNGIMDQVIRHYIDPVHASEILDPTTGKMNRHITRETYESVRQKVKVMLNRDEGLFQDRYEEWYKGMTSGSLEVFMKPDGADGMSQFKNNIDAIVDEAMMYYRVQLTEGMNHMRRGLTGIEGYVYDKWRYGHNFARSWEDDIRKPAQHFSEGFQKYFADNEINMTLAWHRIDGFADARPEFAAAAKKQTEIDWTMIERFKDKVQAGIDLSDIKEGDPDYEELKRFEMVYRIFPKRAKEVDGKSINNFIRHLNHKDYERQMRIYLALPLFEATTDGSYRLQDSSWRQHEEILRHIADLEKWGRAYVDPKEDNPLYMFDEMDGREASRGWFVPLGKKAEGPGKVERDKYLKNLARRIVHAPHEYARIDAVVDGVEQFNDPMFNWSKLSEVSARFHQIESIRERRLGTDGKGLTHIDYFRGPTVEQRTIIDEVFTKVKEGDLTLTVEQYLAIQKALAAKYLDGVNLTDLSTHWDDDGGGEKLEKFAAMRFGRHMIHTVVNDVPWLDLNPNKTSTELRGGGDIGDAYARYVKDNYGGAVEAASALQGTYTLDRKALYENLAKFRQVVKGINDEGIVDATRSIMLMAEAISLEHFDLVQGLTKNDWETSYEQKELGSNASPARNPIEMEHFMDEFAKDGSPALNSPFYWKAAEKKLKVTNWENALGGSRGIPARFLHFIDHQYNENLENRLPEWLQKPLNKIIGHETFHKITHFLDKNVPEYVVLFRGKNLVIYFFLLTGVYIGKQAQGKQGDEHSS